MLKEINKENIFIKDGREGIELIHNPGLSFDYSHYSEVYFYNIQTGERFTYKELFPKYDSKTGITYLYPAEYSTSMRILPDYISSNWVTNEAKFNEGNTIVNLERKINNLTILVADLIKTTKTIVGINNNELQRIEESFNNIIGIKPESNSKKDFIRRNISIPIKK